MLTAYTSIVVKKILSQEIKNIRTKEIKKRIETPALIPIVFGFEIMLKKLTLKRLKYNKKVYLMILG